MDQIQIGKFIAACRKEKGMTQAQLAEKMGVSDRAVSKWETGKNMPDSSIMLELCDTPSGYDPKSLMLIVIKPQPIPKISCPRGSLGDVT